MPTVEWYDDDDVRYLLDYRFTPYRYATWYDPPCGGVEVDLIWREGEILEADDPMYETAREELIAEAWAREREERV